MTTQPVNAFLTLAGASESRRKASLNTDVAKQEEVARLKADQDLADSQMLIQDFIGTVTKEFWETASQVAFSPEPLHSGVGFKGSFYLGDWRADLTLIKSRSNATLAIQAHDNSGAVRAGHYQKWDVEHPDNGQPLRILGAGIKPAPESLMLEDYILSWISRTAAEFRQ